MLDLSAYMSVVEAAKALEKTPGGIRCRIKRGELVAERVGRTFLVLRASVEAALASHREKWARKLATPAEGE